MGWGGWGYFNPTPCCFSLNNSGMVKAVTLAFCSFQLNFIRDIRATFGIPNWPQSLDIGQNSDRGISNVRVSGQSLLKENCHKSRTSDDIDMKLEAVTRLDKRNKTTYLWTNLWPIWSNPEAGFRMHSL